MSLLTVTDQQQVKLKVLTSYEHSTTAILVNAGLVRKPPTYWNYSEECTCIYIFLDGGYDLKCIREAFNKKRSKKLNFFNFGGGGGKNSLKFNL